MPQPNRDLDDLIETLTIDCYGDDEELGAFLQAFEDELDLPAEASVVGVAVRVVAVEHGGDVRRGLVAHCRREGGDYELALANLSLPSGSPVSMLHTAYRRWLGCEATARRRR